MLPSRRSFLTGLIAVTAPAIVRASSLMPVKLMLSSDMEYLPLEALKAEAWEYEYISDVTYMQLGYTITRQAIADNLLGVLPAVRITEIEAANLLSGTW